MSLSDGWAWEQEFGHTTYRHETKRLYSTQQTPRGSVVVLGDRIISDYEMPTDIAQQTADWLNHRKTAP